MTSIPGPGARLRPGGPQKGASFMEVLVATGILTVLLTGLVQLFIYCARLANLGREVTWAQSEVQDKMEEIRRHNYSQIVGDYAGGGTPGNVFALNRVNGVGRVTVNNGNPQLLSVEIVASWRTSDNRLVGEDANLNGALDTGEDANGNGKLDSTVNLVSYVAAR